MCGNAICGGRRRVAAADAHELVNASAERLCNRPRRPENKQGSKRGTKRLGKHENMRVPEERLGVRTIEHQNSSKTPELPVASIQGRDVQHSAAKLWKVGMRTWS